MRSRRNRKSLFEHVYDGIRYIIILVFALFVVVSLAQRFSNNNISVFGYRFFTVISQSMVPRFDIGDILVVKDTNPDDVKIKDNLCYMGKEGEYSGKIITHEVVHVLDKDGKKSFITRGIANDVDDPIVQSDQVIGTVAHKMIVFSLISKVVNNEYGFFVLIFLPLMFFVMLEFKDFFFAVNGKLDRIARRRYGR